MLLIKIHQLLLMGVLSSLNIIGNCFFIEDDTGGTTATDTDNNVAWCSALELQAKQYLQNLNSELMKIKNLESEAKYKYNTNVTELNRNNMIAVTTKNSQFFKDIANDISKFGFKNVTNQYIARQIEILSKLGYNVLTENDNNELLNAISHMQTNYAKVLVCEYKNNGNCNMALEPDIENVIRNSRDPEELKYYWEEFYNKAGAPAKIHFMKYIEIGRKAAQLNGYTSMAESWIDEYEDPKFEENLEEIYQEILPFYKELHGYVRNRLRQKYGDDIIPQTGNIPIHLLGNLWGQTWHSIIEFLMPFPEKKLFDVTAEMNRQDYIPIKIFQLGDEFFQSINMSKLPENFWTDSVLEKPTDGRDIICHASAWDFFLNDVVRIKQCTKVNMEHFYIAHHELGHIQYYLQYQNQPVAFRQAPNPGFHEAVGDVIALSVSTPKHLQAIGLLKDFHYDKENQLNKLFEMALKKFVFLPFAYTMDKYRYAMFRGEIHENNSNCAFWEMRSKHGGIEPAVLRTEQDFDPTAKYHYDADVEYLRYFVAHIFQFQFHKTLCEKAGQYVKGDSLLTLDNCDIDGSTESGNAFKNMLELGASKHWKDALEEFIGQREMTATALLEYFEPLIIWLKAQNQQENVEIGWQMTDKCISV